MGFSAKNNQGSMRRSISPVIAIVVLMLMTVSAAGMAYLTITTYQDEAESASTGGLDDLGSKTKTQVRIESVSEGMIYLRNVGGATLSNPDFYVGGRPLSVSGASECGTGDLCTYAVLEDVSCEGDCKLSMGKDLSIGSSITVSENDLRFVEEAQLITSFNGGSSEKNVSFYEPGSDISVKIELSNNARIVDSSLDLQGYLGCSLDPGVKDVLNGDTASDHFGYSICSGDINADGYDDLLTGAWRYGSGDSYRGRAYVYWGNETGIDSNDRIVFDGENQYDYFGWAVSSGDINADGYDDLLVGARWYNSGHGRVYVFWGNETEDFSSSNNYTTGGEGGQIGRFVSSGDINADGYDDFLVRAKDLDQIYVFWGNTTENFTHLNNYTITGGGSVTSGDLNNDGYDDILSDSGSGVDVFWGNTTENFTHLNNYTINSGGMFGYSFSSGDLNTDGYDDLLITEPDYDSNRGRVYVFWGNTTENFNNLNNYTIVGDKSNDYLGYCVSSGDLNNDNYAELLVGDLDSTSEFAGRVYVFWNNGESGLDPSYNFTVSGENSYDYFGSFISSGDLNKDGYGDLLIGADEAGNGKAYAYYPVKNYTLNPALYPGTDQGSSWNHPGSFDTSATSVNMTDELNNALNGGLCDCAGCSSNSNCTIDLNITSESLGIIELSNLNIQYTLE